MKIKFNRIVNEEFLEPYSSIEVTQRLPFDVIAYKRYNRGEIESDLISSIHQTLEQKNLTSNISGRNGIWVYEPYRCQISLGIGFPYLNEERKEKVEIERFLLGKRMEKAKLRFDAHAQIEGEVNYETFEEIDPNPMIEILKQNDYDTQVITTPQEITEAIEKIKGAYRSSSSSRSSTSNRNLEDSSMMGTLITGALIGSALND